MAKKSKASAQAKHATLRALQRYDIELDQKKLNKIVQMIQEGKGKMVRKQSHRVSIFSLIFEEKEVVVVYDKQRKSIASFLPLEAKEKDTFMGNFRWREDEPEID